MADEKGGNSREQFLIAGLGASAGGLEALEQFFAAVPADSGIAFVVVTHQMPGRVSLMPELLAKRCTIPVVEVIRSTPVQPNRMHLAPPGRNLAIVNGVLEPIETVDSNRPTLPIDHFFRSLAFDQRERAVGIVLSGTGTDGTFGLKEIKGASGMTMAQTEASARYAGMPHSAIATEQVDYILPAPELARQLLAYARGAIGRPPEAEPDPSELNRVFVLLRNGTGHDFSQYKRTTIRRRIERRMNLHQIEALADYVRYLQQNPGEVDLLFKELLIGVTSFFRDREAFEVLEQNVLPDVLGGKPDDHVVRVWVPGCSTGEEAYSLAMLLRETMDRLKCHYSVQIFATDIDAEAIDLARAGCYPESIAADVTPERLERFFSHEDGFYRIRKDIRESLVFAQQNVITDPPFTKLDLLSCRNLLIYLDAALQQRLLPLFHYALRPNGVLFLGSSESVGSFVNQFDAIEKKWKIFRRRDVPTSGYVADMSPTFAQQDTRAALPLATTRRTPEAGVAQLAERAILQNLVPPSAIVHERGEIVHIHGRTGQFLEPAPGPQHAVNIFNMLREGLQLDLAVAIRHAGGGQEVLHRGVRVKRNGDTITVDLRVRKLTEPEALRGMFLVSFERAEPIALEQPSVVGADVNAAAAQRISELDRELQYAKEVHQSTVEELETMNEELKSTNEELQSTNEELQSSNEELETSKEEMQSLNEELQTVNTELQEKIEELSRANDDMKNLLNGTDIATVFLDNQLNIKRFTLQAKKVIRLISSDVGRPVGDLVSKLRYDKLVEDANAVLHTLAFREVEVQSESGEWYLMRVLPYRTTENVIDGLVITFIDVTNLKKLQGLTQQINAALQHSPTSVFGQDASLRYEWTLCTVFGRAAADLVGRTDLDLLGPPARELEALKREVMARGERCRTRLRIEVEGGPRLYDLFLEPVRDPSGDIAGIYGVMTELEEPRG